VHKTITPQETSLMLESWPILDSQMLYVDRNSISQFETIRDIIKAIRNARAGIAFFRFYLDVSVCCMLISLVYIEDYQVELGKKISAFIYCTDESLLSEINGEALMISVLSKVCCSFY
jgi:hypothetical protein